MDRQQYRDLEALSQAVGEPLPVSDWVTITQEMIDQFAASTLDDQWIHTDVERSRRESPFGTTIAHGFLGLSLISRLLMEVVEIESAKMGLNYGLNKARFITPLPVGSRVRLHASIKAVEPYEGNARKVFWDCTLELAGAEKPACVAEKISLLFE